MAKKTKEPEIIAPDESKEDKEESGYKIKERAYKLWKKGYSIVDIAPRVQKSERTVYRWKDSEEWEDRKKKEETLVLRQESLSEVGLAKENLSVLNRLLHKAIAILEDNMGCKEDLVLLRGAVRDYGTLLDKVVRAMAFVDNGGADLTKQHKVEEKIDWNKLINQSIKVKKELGDAFDDEGFVKNAIDQATKRTKK